MADIELLLEAERRGILPPDKAELLGEARRRGLIPGGTVPSSAPPSMLARPDAGGENVGDVGEAAPQPPGVLSNIGSGMLQGGLNIAKGVASLPVVAAKTPGRVWEDVKALATNPAEAIPEQVGRAATFAKGMIPMYESGKSLLTGSVPPAETVSREATEAVGGYLTGKLAIPAATKAAKKVTRSLPGAAVELNEAAATKMRAIPENIRPTPGLAKRTYDLLDSMSSPPVAMQETLTVARDLLRKEMTLAQPDKAFMGTLRAFLNKAQRGMSFKDIQNNVVDIGEKIGNISANKGTKLNEMRDLFAALHTDAANGIPATAGATGPAGVLQVKSGLWDTARFLARRDYAANDLARMIEKPGITTVGDGFTQVNTNAIVSQIEDMLKLAKQDKKAKLFTESFRPGELEDIVTTLKAIGKEAPKVPAKTGTPVGSSTRYIESGVGGLVGGAVGGSMGSPGLGVAVGAMAGPIVSTMIAKAMMSPSGRALVRKAIGPTGTITPQTAALIGSYLKAEGQN